MDTKSKNTIKEVIKDLLQFRKLEFHRIMQSEDAFVYNCDMDEYEKVRKERAKQVITEKYDKPLIKLNNLLEIADRNKELVDIEMQMKKIQAKKYISVKEFTEIYGKSSDWQRNRRGRIRNKLPFMQEKSGSNVMYKVEDIEVWFQNNS